VQAKNHEHAPGPGPNRTPSPPHARRGTTRPHRTPDPLSAPCRAGPPASSAVTSGSPIPRATAFGRRMGAPSPLARLLKESFSLPTRPSSSAAHHCHRRYGAATSGHLHRKPAFLEPSLGYFGAPTTMHCPALPHPRRSFNPSPPTASGSAVQPRRSRPRPSSAQNRALSEP
jgi:hypothetical protein